MVMFQACKEFCYYLVDDKLPEWMDVEHQDHNRKHNCITNLLLLDRRIHNFLSSWSRPCCCDAPDWVLAVEHGGLEDDADVWSEGRE